MAFPNSTPQTTPKAPKGQMRCFQCRKFTPIREGNWLNWQNQQVFLCKACDKSTQSRPERKA